MIKKNRNVFIDSSAWLAILDENNPHYTSARAFFKSLLEQNARLVCNSYIMDETIAQIKREVGNPLATEFLLVIEESVLTINLKIDWLSRRVRRVVLDNYIKNEQENLELRHFYIYETLKRKRIDYVFSFDKELTYFNFPVMPQKQI